MMWNIPDAPYIRAAERFGTDYTSEWYGFAPLEDEEEYPYPTDEEMEEMMEAIEADEQVYRERRCRIHYLWD